MGYLPLFPGSGKVHRCGHLYELVGTKYSRQPRVDPGGPLWTQ